METETVETDVVCSLIVPKWDEGHAELKWKKGDEKDTKIAREAFIKWKALGYAATRAKS